MALVAVVMGAYALLYVLASPIPMPLPNTQPAAQLSSEAHSEFGTSVPYLSSLSSHLLSSAEAARHYIQEAEEEFLTAAASTLMSNADSERLSESKVLQVQTEKEYDFLPITSIPSGNGAGEDEGKGWKVWTWVSWLKPSAMTEPRYMIEEQAYARHLKQQKQHRAEKKQEDLRDLDTQRRVDQWREVLGVERCGDKAGCE